jgi:hypothetical protein
MGTVVVVVGFTECFDLLGGVRGWNDEMAIFGI